MAINYKREIRIIHACIALSLFCFLGLYHYLGQHAYAHYLAGNTREVAETALFGFAMSFVAYGVMLYQICLAGCYKRKSQHTPAPREALESLYEGRAPSLSVIIPSYKEERIVNWQTMMSAALSEYPSKNVVLLIDDPHRPKALEDIVKLEEARRIPQEMQALFDAPREHYLVELEGFRDRAQTGLNHELELKRLASLYDGVANWLDGVAASFLDGRKKDAIPFADKFFVEAILEQPAALHREQAAQLRARIEAGEMPGEAFLERHYKRLVGLFTVNFHSFERKKYANLSHEANKAMNLNSYITLIGKSWREMEMKDGLHLVECAPEEADFTIPAADYVNTIDADSLMLHDYCIRVIYDMEQPENHRIAVTQSTCSSFPGCPNLLERAAGASIDVQFLTHQGYTHWNATFWVGANAMLRRQALEDIREEKLENGYPVSIYIQDRTVIEDTESTIDLVSKGWKLHNYPERMTFSATPPDFGSLLIQRRRWSNGGLIILPKLLGYALRAPKNAALAQEMFMRFFYLAGTTSSCMVAMLFIFYPFKTVFSSVFLWAFVVPYLFLYARDLKHAGYSYWELPRICALNLMLLPIMTGGVLKQFQQMATGKKIPFCRTPKVPGRTAAPAFYCALEVLVCAGLYAIAYVNFEKGQWTQAGFSLVNAGFMTYALVYFMGIRATFEDMFAGLISRFRKAVHSAEIIPIPAAQESLSVVSLPALSKTA